jgi:hypothetical protein
MAKARMGSPVPSFARDFPRHAALDALVLAFGRGDYARVRAEGPKLASSGEPEEVRRAARILVERTNADPLAVGLLALASALLIAIAGYWVVHGKAPPGNAPAGAPAQRVERVR